MNPNQKFVITISREMGSGGRTVGRKLAQRLGVKTPCAVKGDRCFDCKSPQRICRALVVLWEAVKSCEMEVVLVDEDLGY